VKNICRALYLPTSYLSALYLSALYFTARYFTARYFTVLCLVLFAIVVTGTRLEARAPDRVLASLIADDPVAFAAIARYPAPLRRAVLEASVHPEAVVRLADLQRDGTAKFEDLLQGLKARQRQGLRVLAAFPELVAELAAGPPPARLDRILGRYPVQVRAAANSALRHRPLLVRLERLNRRAISRFDRLLSAYPPRVRQSLRHLADAPEAVWLLSENMALTVLLGDAYHGDSEAVERHLAAVSAMGSGQGGANKVGGAPRPGSVEAAAQAYYDQYGLEDREAYGRDDVDVDVSVAYYADSYAGYYGYPYGRGAGYASLGWRLTPQLSAYIHLPIGGRSAPGYRTGHGRHYTRSHNRLHNRPHKSHTSKRGYSKGGHGNRRGGTRPRR
jgi:hypothetical protein